MQCPHVKTPRRRLTCRGDLARAARRAHLLATSLWELVTDAVAMVSQTSSSDPHSSYYAIEGGMGKRIRGREAWAWWRGNDRMRSNKWKRDGKEETRSQHNGGSFALCSMHPSKWEWRLSQHDLSFIPWPFEGRLNPRIALRPFCPLVTLVGQRPILNGIQWYGLCYLRNIGKPKVTTSPTCWWISAFAMCMYATSPPLRCASTVGKHLFNYAYRLRCVHYSMHTCDEMEEHLEWVMPPPHPHLMRGKLVNGPKI